MFRRSFVYVKHSDSSGRAGGLAFGIVTPDKNLTSAYLTSLAYIAQGIADASMETDDCSLEKAQSINIKQAFNAMAYLLKQGTAPQEGRHLQCHDACAEGHV